MMKQRGKYIQAFALIELLVAMAIITLLTAIALPALSSARERAHYARWQGFSHNLRTDPDLIAYYNFEQTPGDLTLENKAAGDVMNREYTAKDFDGDIGASSLAGKWTHDGRWAGKPSLTYPKFILAEAVEIPGQTNANDTDRLSVTAWIRAERKPIFNIGYVVNQWWYIGSNDRSWSVNFNGNKIEWRISSDGRNGGADKCRVDIRQYYGEWMYIAGTYDGTTMKLYINGKLVDTKKHTGLYKSPKPIFIGAGADGNWLPFDGQVDEIAIFKRALSEEEILNQYRMGRP